MVSQVRFNEVTEKAKLAKEAVQSFHPSTASKNELLRHMADKLVEKTTAILEANEKDLVQGKEQGLSTALLDRLALNPARIQAMAEGLKQISELPDPVGEVLEAFERPNGLLIQKVRVPLGVIGMIYEARPNVTVDSAGLCLKAGNAVILRGGSTALHSNRQLVSILHEAMEALDFPSDYVQLIEDRDRSSVEHLLTCKEYIDVLIPRGGRSLIQHVVNHAVVPIIETGEGICHMYVHEDADPERAQSIVVNAKCQRPSVCNAIETILIDRAFAERHLQSIAAALKENGVEVKGCPTSKTLVPWLGEATEEDWSTEYLDLTLSIKTVNDMDEAIRHIQTYGTKHSEAIITENKEKAQQFMNQVDAAAVYHNASTRFTDGFEFGFGAEIGISTQKLHARGPMGLRELTSYKFIIHGNGQIRA